MNTDKIKEEILDILSKHPEKEYTVQELAQHLSMDDGVNFKFVVRTIANLEHDKLIEHLDNDTFKAKKSFPHYNGIFHGNERGFGFVSIVQEDESATPIEDFFVGQVNTLNALNGDEVEVEQITEGDPTNDIRPEGKVVRIISRSLTQVVGEFRELDEAGSVNVKGVIGQIHLTDKKLSNYTVLVLDKGLHPVPGEVVLADIVEYPSDVLPNVIQVVAKQTIGNVNDPGVDILQIVYKHQIPTEFPEEVMEQVSHIPDYVTDEEKQGRVDLTNQKLVTIDSIESKDLDDAVNVWKLDNGNYHLGVHIADVSHYVTPGTPLDKEAYERGTSVYLTDRVIPMLPHKLSNGICSLNPHVERLAMTCEMEITPEGEVVNHKIFPSVIRSTERMTYIAINKIIESHDEKTMKRYADLVPMFQDMAELHKILLKMRRRRGAIEFEDDEAKIIVDEKGHPIDIVLRVRGTSERMVESFMLAANETVAAHYNKKHVPFVYRVHEKPKMDRIAKFFEFLSALGITVAGKKEEINAKMLQGIMKQVAGKPEEAMVSTMMLRSMQQAKYSPEPLGHFGIAAPDYTHFTSPIRRYPDLEVHRLIRYYAENGISEEAQAKYRDDLPELTKHTSEMERRAIDAERDTDAMKKAEYMSDHVGEQFDAVVSSVTKFGMFIALPNTVEGLIHISNMKDDFYVYLEKQMALVGRRYKRTFRIGTPIKVELVSVNAELKEVNFKLIDVKSVPKSDLLEGVELPKRTRSDEHRRGSKGKKSYKHRYDDRSKTEKRGKKPFYRNRKSK